MSDKRRWLGIARMTALLLALGYLFLFVPQVKLRPLCDPPGRFSSLRELDGQPKEFFVLSLGHWGTSRAMEDFTDAPFWGGNGIYIDSDGGIFISRWDYFFSTGPLYEFMYDSAAQYEADYKEFLMNDPLYRAAQRPEGINDENCDWMEAVAIERP